MTGKTPGWLRQYRTRILSPDEFRLLGFVEQMATQIECSAQEMKETMPPREKRRRGTIDAVIHPTLQLYADGPGAPDTRLPSHARVTALADEGIFVQARSQMEDAAPLFGQEVAAVWGFWLLSVKDPTLRLTRARAGIILDRLTDQITDHHGQLRAVRASDMMLAIELYVEACRLTGAAMVRVALEEDILESTEQLTEWLRRVSHGAAVA